jgi:medium-chain acyl-[acyl-carrier-protein] hydrolase
MISRTHFWLAYRKPNAQAKLRLFCFPYAGGAAMIFRTWQDNLPKTVEVCPVELPGRGMRLLETPFTQLLPLVEAIAHAFLPYLDRPFAFFGHSMGGLVSFELARQFRREYNLCPVHLFVSGHRAPQLLDPDSPIHALPKPALVERLRRLNGTPKVVLDNADLMQVLLPVLRADFAVCETYTYTAEPPLQCPITAFGGLRDHLASHEDLEAWRAQTSTSFSLYMLPGDHFFVQTAQLLLLQALSRELHQIASIINRRECQ